MKSNLIFLLLLVSTLLISCSAKYRSRESKRYLKNYKTGFIEGFKTLSFCKCVEYGNNRKLNLQLQDASCRVPDYLFNERETIDSLARAVSNAIELDSVERSGRVAEGMEGKRVMALCLEFYKSEKLNAVAKSRFRRNRKQQYIWHD